MALCDLQGTKQRMQQGFELDVNQRPVSSMFSAPRAGARCHMSGCIAQGMMYLVHHASLAAWHAHLLDLITRNDRCCKPLSPWDVSHFTHTLWLISVCSAFTASANVNKHKAKVTGELVSHLSGQTSCVINHFFFLLCGLRQMVPFRWRSPLPPPFFTLRHFHHEKCILTTSSRAKLQRGLC